MVTPSNPNKSPYHPDQPWANRKNEQVNPIKPVYNRLKWLISGQFICDLFKNTPKS
jgi:hypothetical protein